MKKVSFICTTYRRYHCVRRVIKQYLDQDYRNSELIIFNTDTQYPMSLHPSLFHTNIKVINCSIDYLTGLPYTNRGAICRDAVTHTTGDYFMLADDDDLYLPWHFRQAVNGITLNGKDSWKPEKSFFASRNHIELSMNTMEASVIVKMERIREIGFRTDATGYEGLSWYTRLRDEGQLDEHELDYVPSYCFNWSDPPEIAGHKQSGDINNPNNFENHKEQSTDFSTEPLTAISTSELIQVHSKYYEWLSANRSNFSPKLFDEYVKPYI